MRTSHPCPFCVPQVLETWLTCVCWHVTWNSWIVCIYIDRKCLFNNRFSSFYFHLCCWEIQKSCLPALSAAKCWFSFSWYWLFDSNWILVCAALVLSTLQLVRKFKKKCPFRLHSHAYITPCPFRNATNLCLLAFDLDFLDYFHRNSS